MSHQKSLPLNVIPFVFIDYHRQYYIDYRLVFLSISETEDDSSLPMSKPKQDNTSIRNANPNESKIISYRSRCERGWSHSSPRTEQSNVIQKLVIKTLQTS